MCDSTYSKYLLQSKPQKLKAERWRHGLEGDREKQGSQCAESSSLQDETPWRSDSTDSPNTAELNGPLTMKAESLMLCVYYHNKK